MLNAIIKVVTLITKLISKAQTDPDVQALVTALEELVNHHTTPPPAPPVA